MRATIANQHTSTVYESTDERAPLRLQTRPSPGRLSRFDPALGVVLAISLLYAVIFATVSVMRYSSFGMGDDITDYAQMIWNTAHGRWLSLTHLGSLSDGVRGGHIEPFLTLLALPYRLFPDPRTLLICQTLALAAAGPLVYAMGRVHGHTRMVALALAAFYLLFPHVQSSNLHEFHPDPFAVIPLLGALICFDTGRWRLLACCVALSLTVKENIVPFVFGLGLYWWLARGAARVGLLTAGAAVLYTLAVVVPWYLLTADQFSHDYGGFFADLNSALHATSHGHAGWGARLSGMGAILADRQRWDDLVLALLPTGFLFLLDASGLIALPPLLALFVGSQQLSSIWFHHYVAFTPIFLYAISRALARPRLRRHGHTVALMLVAWSALLGYIYAAQPISMLHWIYAPSSLQGTDHSRAQAAFARHVPDAAPLDADPVLAAHLAHRRYLYKLWEPREAQLASYIALDFYADEGPHSYWRRMEVGTADATLAFMHRGWHYQLVFADRRHGLYLYRNCSHVRCGIARR